MKGYHMFHNGRDCAARQPLLFTTEEAKVRKPVAYHIFAYMSAYWLPRVRSVQSHSSTESSSRLGYRKVGYSTVESCTLF